MTTTVPSRLQFQDYQFKVAMPAGIWTWTTRLDLSQGVPQFEIRDVRSPYGLMVDRIPIPGQVITEMAASITTLQSAFAPKILAAPTSLSFTLNEGEGVSYPQSITLTNNGVFGSLLAVSITSSAPWLKVTPANVDGLGFNEAGQVSVTADSSALLALNSPFAATLTVQDTDASNSPQTVPVSLTVLPKATITVDTTSLSFIVPPTLPGNPYPTIPSQQFILSNTGPSGSQLTYLIQKLIGNSPWLVSFSPFMGQLASSQTQAVVVAVAPPSTMTSGTYTETLRISGFSTNMTQDIVITLVI